MLGFFVFKENVTYPYLAISHVAVVFSCFFSPLPWRRWTSLIFFCYDFHHQLSLPTLHRDAGFVETAKLNSHPWANCQEHCSLRAWSKTLAFLWSSDIRAWIWDKNRLPPKRPKESNHRIIEWVDVAIGSTYLGIGKENWLHLARKPPWWLWKCI